MNGWGQFFLALLVLLAIAGGHRRYMRYRIIKKMIENEYGSEDIVDVMDSYARENIVDRYIDGDG